MSYRLLVCWPALTILFSTALSADEHSPQAALRKMSVPEGLAVTQFASEPEIRQPIFCKCDERGRLWTIQYLQYPNPAGLKRVKVDRYSRTEYDRKPEPPPRGPQGADRITICEDTDGDGRADKFKDFVTGLNLCTGVEFGFGGVFVIQAPYLLFYPDRNRDDIPDSDPEVLLDGFGIEDSQSLANHLTWGPDGWLYGLNGSTTTCRIQGIEFQQGVWRYHPLTKKFELFCEGGGNLFGLTFDRKGRLFYSSNGGVFYHAVQGGYYEKNFGKHGPLHNPYAYGFFKNVTLQGQTGRPNPGGTVYTGETFPHRFHDAFLCSDFLTHTCSWWQLAPRGSTVQGKLGGLLVESNDNWFGATDLCLGPQGEIYVTDFYDRRTAHPDPDAQWDTSNGRIYRLQSKDVSPKPIPHLLQASTSELVELLKQPNGWLRDRVRRQLAERRDPQAIPLLKTLVAQTQDENLALQGLWALHVSGQLNAAYAREVLQHPAEHLRAWTVRLIGDEGTVEHSLAEPLLELGRSDPSVQVRAQLAASAKRIPGVVAVPLLQALMQRDLDRGDLYVPLMLWWGLESKAVSHRDHVLSTFAVPASWPNETLRDNVLRLLRRYAAEGTPAGYAACQRIISSRQIPSELPVVDALLLGLRERPRGAADGNFLVVPEPLQHTIREIWQRGPEEDARIRLAIEAGLQEPLRTIVSGLKSERFGPVIQNRLAILRDYPTSDCIPAVLSFAGSQYPEAIRLAALEVLQRFSNPEITHALLTDYPQMSEPLKSRTRDLFFTRPSSTLAFLALVDQKKISPESIPLDQLRGLALLQNPQVDALVVKHWGNLKPGTPEEKLADIRRFNNDLRAGKGDLTSGKALFTKHCATCHKLQGEGNAIGPDLSGTVKGDLNSLLTNIVDPSAVVKRDFLSYTLVTHAGQIYTGLIAAQDAASVTLLDAKNQRQRINRDQIEEFKESPVSLMPEKLLEPLSPQELRDLFAYLQQAGPASTK
ncbi:MAG: PVC-type heme-binding CxxCH protein [Planctomycetales bacterium]